MKRGCTILTSTCYFLLLPILLVIASLSSARIVPAYAATPAFVRIIHASPDVATADVFLDGKKILSDFGFGTITGYVSIPPGPHKVQISLVGEGVGAAVLTQTLAVSPGVAYTVAAIGNTPKNLALKVFVDDNHIAPGMGRVCFYHLSPGTGAVDVLLNGKQVIQGLVYKQASTYIAVQPGAYTFNVAVSQPATQLSVTSTMKADMVTSEFVVGVFNGTPRIEIVSAQVSGIPGMPGTGSDPRSIALPGAAAPPDFAFFPLLALLVIALLLVIGWRFVHLLAWLHLSVTRE